jgi:mRNA interferase MazF
MTPSTLSMPDPRRGEIWWVDFEPATGSEPNKRRPAVVLSLDAFSHLGVRVVIPMTTWQERFGTHLNKIRVVRSRANGLVADSAADILMVRVVSVDRCAARMGRLEPGLLDELAAGVAVIVGAPV